jgi:hypothetical protein
MGRSRNETSQHRKAHSSTARPHGQPERQGARPPACAGALIMVWCDGWLVTLTLTNTLTTLSTLYIVYMQIREGKFTRGGRVFCIIRIDIVFCIVFVFLAPATRDRCGGRKRDGASCLGCTLGTWLCSMSNSIIYHVSCYRFVSQHTYVYHIGPHAHVDTDSDSRLQQQPPAPAPAVAQILNNNTKSSLLYYVLYVFIVLCIVLCIMYFRSLMQIVVCFWHPHLACAGFPPPKCSTRM